MDWAALSKFLISVLGHTGAGVFLWAVMLLILTPVVLLLAYTIYIRGINIFNKIVVPGRQEGLTDEQKKEFEDKLAAKDAEIASRERMLNMASDEHWAVNLPGGTIGFIVPKSGVTIFGDGWNTKDHAEQYNRFEEEWRTQLSINVISARITSTLISIIENKAKQFSKIRIICTPDQKTILHYLEQYPNVEFSS